MTSDEVYMIKEKYDAMAKIYDELYGEEQILKYLDIIKKMSFDEQKILDAGAGSLLFEKFITKTIYGENYWIIALDISNIIIEPYQLLKSDEKVDAVIGDILFLPFREDSFTTITSITVLSGLNKLFEVAIEQLARTCKDDGIIIITLHKKTINENEEKLLKEICKETWNTGLDTACYINPKMVLMKYK